MKRLLVRLILLVLVLVVLAFVAASFMMGSLIKKGVEKVGPAVTKVDVNLQSANLALFSGRGELRGLVVGNPPGFKTPSAIKLGSVAVEVVPGSVFANKVVIHSIKVQAPEVTLEGGLQGNNLSKILENIQATSGQGQSGSTPSSSSAGRKIQVDDFLITDGKLNLSVNLLGQQSATVPLPEIHLSGLGQNAEGITPAELSEKLLKVVLESATKAAASQLTSLTKGLGGAAQAAGTGTVQQVESVTKSLGNLFKKK